MNHRCALYLLGGAVAFGLALPHIASAFLRGGNEGGCGEPSVECGRSECPVCKIIADYGPSSAAMLAVEFGRKRWYLFDDLGCLAVWHRMVRERGGYVEKIYVRDRVTGQWIELEKAVLLITDEFTSMNTGFLANLPQNLRRYKSGEGGPGPGGY